MIETLQQAMAIYMSIGFVPIMTWFFETEKLVKDVSKFMEV